jgi:hypothetical protein
VPLATAFWKTFLLRLLNGSLAGRNPASVVVPIEKEEEELTLCTSTVRSSLLKDVCCSAGLRRDTIVIIVVSSSSSSSYTLIILRSHYLNLMISACTSSRDLPCAAVALRSFPANFSLSNPAVRFVC